MNISELDLNLLHVLHAVLAERSATRAAKRLHVTQSAISNALGRLRRLLGDPLMVRGPRGLVPTARALALAPELERIMTAMQDLLSAPRAFEARTSTRTFTLAGADYCASIFGVELAALLAEQAPRATLKWVPLERLSLGEGLAADIDVHVGMPPRIPSGCRSRALFDDSFVCLVPKKNVGPVPARLGLEAYLAGRHVRVSVLGSSRDPIDEALAARGLARTIALEVSHFSVLAELVERTGCIATLSKRLAEAQARRHQVALCEPPIALGRRAMRLIWHDRTHLDEGGRFFRGLVQEAAGRS